MPAANIQDAQRKWEEKMQGAQAAYDAALPNMPQNYQAGLARFGVTPGPLTLSRYQRGIQGGGARLAQNTSGKGEKWARKFQQGISR